METVLAQLTLLTGGLALLCLAALHVVSPEFNPSWRMISEYALGQHAWLITAFFLLWGLSTALLSGLLWNVVTGPWAMVGVLLLVISATGAAMGGLFDVKHKLHGLAFMLGVPALPIAALLLGYHLSGRELWAPYSGTILLVSHAPWIGAVLMAVAMAVMLTGFQKAGMPMGPDIPAPEHVPPGVIALAGYTNRLLVVCYVGWLLTVAGVFASAGRP